MYYVMNSYGRKQRVEFLYDVERYYRRGWHKMRYAEVFDSPLPLFSNFRLPDVKEVCRVKRWLSVAVSYCGVLNLPDYADWRSRYVHMIPIISSNVAELHALFEQIERSDLVPELLRYINGATDHQSEEVQRYAL